MVKRNGLMPMGFVHFDPENSLSMSAKNDHMTVTGVSDLTQELVLLKKKQMKTNRNNLSVTMWSQDVAFFL
ncbi:hypothetical protein F9K33_09020 [bacterium]|nr:MAG: hypothetical protein F9K33_09020 [bacterium]